MKFPDSKTMCFKDLPDDAYYRTPGSPYIYQRHEKHISTYDKNMNWVGSHNLNVHPDNQPVIQILAEQELAP